MLVGERDSILDRLRVRERARAHLRGAGGLYCFWQTRLLTHPNHRPEVDRGHVTVCMGS